MNPQTIDRLFGWRHAFDHPVTVGIVIGLGAILVLSFIVIGVLRASPRFTQKLKKELLDRYRAWVLIVPLAVIPILLGAAWTIAGVTLLGLLCFGEFARSTGLFRDRLTTAVAVLGILLLNFAVLDHWYHFFVALFPLVMALLAAAAILRDEPKGYLQRVALGVFGFALMGGSMAHLGYMANDRDYRPILLLVIAATQLNDVFAYIVGKSVGRHPLAPQTSPNKTVEGFVGAVLLTTPIAAVLGHFVFQGTPIDTPTRLALLGLIISVVGQLGDLMVSSIKRDLGIKDMGAAIPGHGGVLDRCNSLLLVAPGVFHYVGYYVGFGLDQQKSIITGG
ncbi:MAG TPA: phosphatidate cytidylyltransferase [Planctomycetota bacterium]|nr:phosphatidate cytidylyltransferase [Planctomycetota bacterium]